MAQLTLRDALTQAGVENLNVIQDDDGIKADGWFDGSEAELRDRLGDEWHLQCLEAPAKPTYVLARSR